MRRHDLNGRFRERGAWLLAAALAFSGPALAGGDLVELMDMQLQEDLMNTGKVSSGVSSAAAAAPEGELGVIVLFKEDSFHAEGAVLFNRDRNENLAFDSVSGIKARLTVDDIEYLAADPAVEFVAIDAELRATLDLGRDGIGEPEIGPAFDALTGAGVTIAVLDSGIHTLHTDLRRRVVASVDMIDAKADPGDPFGHGTHVAGIIAGSGIGSSGLYRGVAPKADLVSVRVLDGGGAGTVSDVIRGIEWVLANKDAYGIRVVNLSLGHPIYEPAAYDPLVRAVEKMWAEGLVVICSAGNRGANGFFTVTSPGNARNVITVGSMTDWNTDVLADDIVSTYSSHGPTLVDHYLKPDVVAPGNRLISLRSPGSMLDATYPEWQVAGLGDEMRYFEMSGTSMAAPMVAGTVALMLEHKPALNNASIKARLMRTAHKVPGDSPYAQGAGRIDVAGALQATDHAASAPSPVVLRHDDGTITVEDVMGLWGDGVLWGDSVPRPD